MPINYIADAVAVATAIMRQVEIWQRTPADPFTEAGRAELLARHERVRAFMKIVQTEADELRPAAK